MPTARRLLLATLLVLASHPAGAEATEPLTREQVADYIRTRVITDDLQDRMKANADQYQDVVRAFFKKRKEVLKERGWTVKEFESVEKRSLRALNAMEAWQDLEERKESNQEQLAAMERSGNFSEKELREIRTSMKKALDQRRARLKESKPDWPAVRPYREELRQLTDYVADNTSEPPEVDP